MILSAFIFGLLSSFHCVGMCGPIAFALPVHNGTTIEKWIKIILYHLGRLFTYAIIGALFGLFGRAFVMAGLQQTLSIITGLILIFVALFQETIMWYMEQHSSVKIIKLIKKGYQNIVQSKSTLSFLVLGFMNGLLPCGTVYIALIGALAMGNIAMGSWYMFVFGMGTMPLMLLFMSVKFLNTQRFKTIFRRAVPVMLVVVGSLFVLRGLGLGIAFVSPSDMSLQIQLVPIGCH
ncbi:sulfite exporter TauE/SafE family protein [Wenyingzhuangia sp. IMCC45467]